VGLNVDQTWCFWFWVGGILFVIILLIIVLADVGLDLKEGALVVSNRHLVVIVTPIDTFNLTINKLCLFIFIFSHLTKLVLFTEIRS